MADEQITNDKRYIGKITKVKEDEGWGFITSQEIPFTRIFFHWTALTPSLNFATIKKGMKVSFHVIDYVDKNSQEDKGKRALKIMLAE